MVFTGSPLKWLIAVISLLLLPVANAASPLWTLTSLTPTTISVPSNGTATVQYTVTNQSKRTHTFSMQTVTGIHQNTSSGNCSNAFTLGYQQSCTLTLDVIGSEVTGDIKGGPVVCQQGSSLQCYQPSISDSLNITLTHSIVIALSPSSLPSGKISTAYLETITASGGTAPYSYAVTSGSLPLGLSLSSSSGVISGTPTTVNSSSFTITATDSTAKQGSQNYTLNIVNTLSISPTIVPIALVDVSGYSQTLTATGGTAPYTYTISAGALPTGMSLNSSTGVISGTPTSSSETYSFTVSASDTNGDNGSQSYTMTLAKQFCMAADENLGSWSYDNVSGTWLQIGVSALPNGINYISCPSTEFCIGVDNNNAYVYNGITWSSATPLTTGFNLLTSVSCPTTSFCQASDNDGNAYSYNGESWSSATLVDTYDASAGLACSSPSFCMIFDDIVSIPPGTGSNYAIFNGTSWGAIQPVSTDGSMPNIDALSCASSSFCVAGNVSPSIGVRQYNGTSWGSVISLSGATNIIGTSCPNSSFCMAVDQSDLAYKYNGTWSSVSAPFSDGGPVQGVSCPSDSFCMTVGQNSASTNAESAVSTNGGSTWTAVTINDSNNSLFNVSCLASP